MNPWKEYGQIGRVLIWISPGPIAATDAELIWEENVGFHIWHPYSAHTHVYLKNWERVS